jgi:hypothetical protein
MRHHLICLKLFNMQIDIQCSLQEIQHLKDVLFINLTQMELLVKNIIVFQMLNRIRHYQL